MSYSPAEFTKFNGTLFVDHSSEYMYRRTEWRFCDLASGTMSKKSCNIDEQQNLLLFKGSENPSTPDRRDACCGTFSDQDRAAIVCYLFYLDIST